MIYYRKLSPIKRLLLMNKLGGGGSVVVKTVTQAAPITIHAVSKPIVSLTQTGKVTQASTPTPSSPVDLVCNNGALRMVDDELPTGYKRVLGFTCDNNAMWQITGFKLRGSDTVRISFSVTAACNVFGCYQGTEATDNYDLYVSTTSGSKYFRYGSGTYLSYWSSANLGVRFDVVYTPNGTTGMPQDSTWTPATFTSANDLLIGATTLTGTSSKLKGNLYGNFVVDGRLKLIPCERVSDGTLGYYDTYTATFYEPYEGFDGAVSLGYDGSHYHLETVGTPEVLTVAVASDSRLPKGYTPLEYVENAGTGYIDTGIVLNTADLDVEIDFQTNGDTSGQPKMAWGFMGNTSSLPRWGFGTYNSNWLGSPNNSVPKGTADNDRHIVVSRVYQNGDNYEYNGLLDDTILYSESDMLNVSLFLGNTLSVYLFARNNNGTVGNNFTGKIYGFKVTKADVVIHELIPCKNASNEIGFYDIKTETFTGAIGTLTGEVKYTTIGTASVENLYAVGDYKDTQEIIGGVVTRRVGVKVLNGTELIWYDSWVNGFTVDYSAFSNIDTMAAFRAQAVTTHFASPLPVIDPLDGVPMTSGTAYWLDNNDYGTQGLTMANSAWNNPMDVSTWLAANPVIVLYPLAEETTESVTPQALQTVKGDNTVSVTSNVDPVTLTVVYKGTDDDHQ